MKALNHGLSYFPWVVGLGLLVARLARKGNVSLWGYAIGALTPYLGLLAWLFGTPTVEQWQHSRPFTPTAWRQDADSTDVMWPTRLRMIDDLLAHHPLVGLTRDSVIALLGPSDSTSYWSEWDMVYWLGPERGIVRMDSEWLVLRIAGGTVTEATIVRD